MKGDEKRHAERMEHEAKMQEKNWQNQLALQEKQHQSTLQMLQFLGSMFMGGGMGGGMH